MGYSCYYLDEEEAALSYFQRALELHPGDDPKYNTTEEIQNLINDCRRWLAVRRGERLVLTQADVEELEGMCEGPAGYFYKMLAYLEECIPGWCPGGSLHRGPGQADLEVALWYSYACNNVGTSTSTTTGRQTGCPPLRRRPRPPGAASGITGTPVH